MVDEQTLTLISAVARAAEELGVPWLLTGAMARALLLENVYGLTPGRATMDVDVVVTVETWGKFGLLTDRICQDPRFSRDPKQAQRLRCSAGGYLDRIPFGGIEAEGHLIRWPPDGSIEMNVSGFREACTHAQIVIVNDSIPVPVISPEGLTLVKFIAWRDRHREKPRKDASDLAYLLRHYATVFSTARLFDEHPDALEAADYDPELAAARVLGRELARISNSDTAALVSELLSTELKAGEESDLVREVAEGLSPRDRELAFRLLTALL
ncbi:MAG: nucleotidyl transferase AbiEii/AbiGii toxin family protein, partial [Deltaproteobacteria bacterium]|nr:nucleotidyl transferase AbiEii/AbiGii toxin family protein [Deltaproteobacteria bacterium]